MFFFLLSFTYERENKKKAHKKVEGDVRYAEYKSFLWVQ